MTWHCPCGHELSGDPSDPPFACVVVGCPCAQCSGRPWLSPLWRVGHKQPRNIYLRDHFVAVCVGEESEARAYAAKMVERMNREPITSQVSGSNIPVKIDLTKEQLDDFVQFLHDAGWTYDESDETVYCQCCQESFPSKRPWPHDGVADAGWCEHKPECVVKIVMDQLEKIVDGS